MKTTTIGLDLAKNSFQVHVADERGEVQLRKKLTRKQLREFFHKQPACRVAMEACGSAHHWGRVFREMGHEVCLIAPQYVKPYVKSQKNDAADAEAICEASTRAHMRFVALKSVEQQALLALHVVRTGLVKQRTALSNQVRGLLAEFGEVLPQGLAALRTRLPELLSEANSGLHADVHELMHMLLAQLRQLDDQIGMLELKIKMHARQNEDCQRLQQMPGIGPISASALVASVGDARQFESGRQMSAWMGMVPRQHSTGGKNVLLGITKRGDKYLRTLFIHGARAALKVWQKYPKRMPQWVSQLLQRKHPNVVCVALASRNIRVAWAMLTRGEDYRPNHNRMNQVGAVVA